MKTPRFTKEQIEKAEYATIAYPTMGSVYLKVERVLKASDDKLYVEGAVWEESGYNQYNMPEDYHGEYVTMNFPITCVMSLS